MGLGMNQITYLPTERHIYISGRNEFYFVYIAYTLNSTNLSVACIQYIASMDLVTAFAMALPVVVTVWYTALSCKLHTNMVSCGGIYYTVSLESGVLEQLKLLYKHWKTYSL